MALSVGSCVGTGGIGYVIDRSGILGKTHEFSISSLTSNFFELIVLFEGTYKVHSLFIEVELNKIEIRLRDDSSFKDHRDRTISSLAIGLGETTPQGWGVSSKDRHEINKLIKRKGVLSLDKMQFKIPKSPFEKLSERWLVVELENSEQGFSYAHSPRSIFVTGS